MRVLQIETFGRGGLTHYAYNLVCALAARGEEVIFVTTAGYELENHGLPADVRLVKLIARLTPRLEGRLPAFATRVVRGLEAVFDAVAVAWFTRRVRPDVVHLHCTNPIALLYSWLLRLTGSPLVATAHVVTPHERIPFQESIYRWLHGLSGITIAHSEVDRQRLITEFAVAPDRTVVIPHGEYGFFARGREVPDRVSARARLGFETVHEVVLFFGYIREYKGLDVLLDAWHRVRATRPDARLVVAGDPVRLDPARRLELEKRAIGLGATTRFDYIPFSDVPHYFAAADVLVMPYRRIGQSGVLFLALSLGVPVVATRVGALPELLRDGESALLIPPESPADLTEALIRVLSDAGLAERLAAGGRLVALAHSWTAIAEQTAEVFARAVNR